MSKQDNRENRGQPPVSRRSRHPRGAITSETGGGPRFPIAFIGLGSNLGDRAANLREAISRLAEAEGVAVLRVSPVYETDPVGPVEQGPFLNAVIMVKTGLGPRKLLAACLAIETTMGRTRTVRWGPRTIDLDLLLYGDHEESQPDLAVPHPELTTRAFVLVPLADLAPEASLPDGRTVRDLLRAIEPVAGIRRVRETGKPGTATDFRSDGPW